MNTQAHRLPHTLSEPRRSIAPSLRAMCTPSELAWLIKERDLLMAEREQLVAALRDTQEHLEARPNDTGLDIIRQKNRALLARLGAE